MEQATCRKCGKVKALAEFDKHLAAGPLAVWNVRHCKECTHAAYTARMEVPERRAALNAAARNWKRANPERHAELAREYRARHPERITAQNRLNYAIKKGRIKRQPCEVCATTERVHAHHISYEPADWYNVRWLCHVCHTSEHAAPKGVTK